MWRVLSVALYVIDVCCLVVACCLLIVVCVSSCCPSFPVLVVLLRGECLLLLFVDFCY